jgi:hypothetical protein
MSESMPKQNDAMDHFLELSALLTGFGRLDLVGTGMADLYFETLNGTIAEAICSELWAKSAELQRQYANDPDRLEEAVAKEIVVADPKLGPVATAIVQMWYLGEWPQMPAQWREQYGTNPNDFQRILSAAAYVEGLVWRVAGTHPQGAKQPGFGTWSAPPVQIAVPAPPSARQAPAGEQR